MRRATQPRKNILVFVALRGCSTLSPTIAVRLGELRSSQGAFVCLLPVRRQLEDVGPHGVVFPSEITGEGRTAVASLCW